MKTVVFHLNLLVGKSATQTTGSRGRGALPIPRRNRLKHPCSTLWGAEWVGTSLNRATWTSVQLAEPSWPLDEVANPYLESAAGQGLPPAIAPDKPVTLIRRTPHRGQPVDGWHFHDDDRPIGQNGPICAYASECWAIAYHSDCHHSDVPETQGGRPHDATHDVYQ